MTQLEFKKLIKALNIQTFKNPRREEYFWNGVSILYDNGKVSFMGENNAWGIFIAYLIDRIDPNTTCMNDSREMQRVYKQITINDLLTDKIFEKENKKNSAELEAIKKLEQKYKSMIGILKSNLSRCSEQDKKELTDNIELKQQLLSETRKQLNLLEKDKIAIREALHERCASQGIDPKYEVVTESKESALLVMLEAFDCYARMNNLSSERVRDYYLFITSIDYDVIEALQPNVSPKDTDYYRKSKLATSKTGKHGEIYSILSDFDNAVNQLASRGLERDIINHYVGECIVNAGTEGNKTFIKIQSPLYKYGIEISKTNNGFSVAFGYRDNNEADEFSNANEFRSVTHSFTNLHEGDKLTIREGKYITSFNCSEMFDMKWSIKQVQDAMEAINAIIKQFDKQEYTKKRTD